ncbi:hypothetical protein PR048_031811 [Dryococelus australis]|uniref:Uncharacterized protein n=1 Tax=Dryococelus australis TaxID=614101 RepID=A0ABQ9G948_9NEOP|nr:hypothetical protein PR048_031811 [Dryococelus australis]
MVNCLLLADDLTFDKACKIVFNMESANQSANKIVSWTCNKCNNKGHTSKFCFNKIAPYEVPCALRDSVKKGLLSLENKGVLYKINYSQWASRIVCP